MYAKKNYEKYLSALKNSGLVSVEEKAQGAAADVTVGAEGGAGAMVLLGKMMFLKFWTVCMHFKWVQALLVSQTFPFATSKYSIVINSRLIINQMIGTELHIYVCNSTASCELAITNFSSTFYARYA